MPSVIQDWVADNCTLKQQTVLISAIRSCDQVSKEDPCKNFTRALRNTVLFNASPDDGRFMTAAPTQEQVEAFTGDLDRYPLHWVVHFIHAVEVIGYKHPDIVVSSWWREFYLRLVDALHLNPETEAEIEAMKKNR